MAKSRYQISPLIFPRQAPKEPYEFGEVEPYEPNMDRAVGTRDVPATSQLGSVVVDNIRFEAGSYTDANGDVISYEGITIDAVLIRVQQSKQIIRTEVAGRAWTVKEYISDGDYDISISGAFYTTDYTYPTNEVERLIEVLTIPATISVVCPFLQKFNIDQIAISNFSLQQNAGNATIQTFEISALSDRAIELLIDSE